MLVTGAKELSGHTTQSNPSVSHTTSRDLPGACTVMMPMPACMTKGVTAEAPQSLPLLTSVSSADRIAKAQLRKVSVVDKPDGWKFHIAESTLTLWHPHNPNPTQGYHWWGWNKLFQAPERNTFYE
jgi:hypothetical protein